MVSTLAVTSQVIGFVSFGITLLTLLGVYRDLISTLRHAPKQIPLMLGNLRAELEAERVAIRRRLEQGDEFNVFPVPRGRKRIADWKTRRQNLQSSEAAQILNATINTLWAQFKALEAPFLIASPSRAEHVRRGQVYGLEDIDPAARKRYGYDEEKNDDDPGTPTGAPPDGGVGSPADPLNRYYKTDFTHRFIWWQSQRDLTSLMDQVQRIQLRRIERNAWEANELVKRVVRWIGDDGEGRDGEGGRRRSGGGGGPKGGGEGSGSRKRRGVGGKGTGRRSGEVTRERSVWEVVRSSSNKNQAGSSRRRRSGSASSSSRSRSPSRPRPRPRSGDEGVVVIGATGGGNANTGRRRDARSGGGPDAGPNTAPSGGRRRYEVVRPGRIEVVQVVNDRRGDDDDRERRRDEDRDRRRRSLGDERRFEDGRDQRR